MRKKVVLFWSGGKDCTICLQKLLDDRTVDKISLFSTLDRSSRRVSMHGVRKRLVEKQAESLGFEISFLELPENVSMEYYSSRVRERMVSFWNNGYTHAVFGDIFLEDLREYRIRLLKGTEIIPLFPVWGQHTQELAKKFITDGFKANIICINKDVLEDSFSGREYDFNFLQDLPDNVDPCGENGEFHTFVYNGPLFSVPVSFSEGNSIDKAYPSPVENGATVGFRFLDLKA